MTSTDKHKEGCIPQTIGERHRDLGSEAEALGPVLSHTATGTPGFSDLGSLRFEHGMFPSRKTSETRENS